MTVTNTAATHIAANFATLDTDDLDALHSDDGLTITVDGTDVAVWHRQADDTIVAFTSTDGDTEEWAEVPLT